MKVNYTGCAICDSTWGDLWAEVEGERLFFCCAICLVQFQRLVQRIEERTGWPDLDRIAIEGDRRGRRCTAESGGRRYRCEVAFNSEGEIRDFRELPAV